MRDHLLRNPVEDIEREEGDGNAVQHPFLQVLALDGFGVAAALAAKLVDRQPLAMVGAAIAVLAGDCVGAAALGAFQHPAQHIFWSLRRIEPVALPERSPISFCLFFTRCQRSSGTMRMDGTSVSTHSFASLTRAVLRSVSGFLR